MFSAGGDMTSSRFREASRFSFDIPKGVIDDPLGSFFTSVEDEYAYSDDVDGPTYDFEESNSNCWPSQSSKKSRPKVKSNDYFGSGTIKFADQLKETTIKCDHLPPLSLSEVIEGTTVTHPSFGKGTIEGFEGDPAEKNVEMKIKVKFESINQTKKLVFKFAGLRIGA